MTLRQRVEELFSKISTFATETSILYILNVLFSVCFQREYDKNLQKKVGSGRVLERERFSHTTELREDGGKSDSRKGPPSGHTPQESCFSAAITGSKGRETGVTMTVTPVFSDLFGFWGANPTLAIPADKNCAAGSNYTFASRRAFSFFAFCRSVSSVKPHSPIRGRFSD